jgi:outer membrane protein assembly factor BamD
MALVAFVFVGCSDKKVEDINKPADYYYEQMIKSISTGKLDAADSAFTTLSSVHPRSPLIHDSILILADAHMNNEEYPMASFYYDEFLKRFGDKKNLEYIRYLKVKADFLGFKFPLRDQVALMDAIKRCDGFLEEYPNSQYTLFVETMRTKMDVALKLFELNIAQTYNRIDKPNAAKQYTDKAVDSWVDGRVDYKAPSISWWRDIFELHFMFSPYPDPEKNTPMGGGNTNLATEYSGRYEMDAQ